MSSSNQTETSAPSTVFIPTSKKKTISDFRNQKKGPGERKPATAKRSEQFWGPEDVTLQREVRREITSGRAVDGNYKKGQGADSGAGRWRQRRVRGEV